ncbi:uncharacterized protein MONOS_16889 [Monocercomonoides exilis]|uniref:uncharacterized protein n=1 Tax=Monocercomonoides exilis TaxID=2049356 RepID=UPI0035595AAA|nr:hypothetical protein MONOS_16889 [Monocercomonoides exilis]
MATGMEMNDVKIDETDEWKSAFRYIERNDCFWLDWLKWALFTKGMGCLKQGYLGIWIGTMEVLQEMPEEFYWWGDLFLKKEIEKENEEAESG